MYGDRDSESSVASVDLFHLFFFLRLTQASKIRKDFVSQKPALCF